MKMSFLKAKYKTTNSEGINNWMNELLHHSTVQLAFFETFLRENNEQELDYGTREYAKLEEICNDHVESLQLTLSNVEAQKEFLYSFSVNLSLTQELLGKWHSLQKKIKQAASPPHCHIREEMDDLTAEVSTIYSDFEDVDDDRNDLKRLHNKTQTQIQRMLQEQEQDTISLKLQSLNDDPSLGALLHFKEANAAESIKESLVIDALEQKVQELEKGLEALRRCAESEKSLNNFKIIYRKRKAPVIYKRIISTGKNSPKELGFKHKQTTPTKVATYCNPTKWKRVVVRRMIIFNFAFMLAAAYFLRPICCENINTFSFNPVPILIHESVPLI